MKVSFANDLFTVLLAFCLIFNWHVPLSFRSEHMTELSKISTAMVSYCSSSVMIARWLQDCSVTYGSKRLYSAALRVCCSAGIIVG